MRFKSLTGRLVAWSALALAVSLFASAVALDEVYRRDAMDLIREDSTRRSTPCWLARNSMLRVALLPDTARPGYHADSGLYARVLDRTGAVLAVDVLA